MGMNILLKKLYLEKREFITSAELHAYCAGLRENYADSVRYLMGAGYLIRIFKGVFYLKGIEERKLGSSRYTHLELVAKGLEIKGVKEWYFGLHSALKFNNMTHEEFGIEEVMNSEILRNKPMKIAGHNFKVHKISKKLLGFGTVTENGLNYSDKEKTVLDFIYLWRYGGASKEKIASDIYDWAKNLDRKKLEKYSKNYPKAVANMLKEVFNWT
ncbi:MAG TPA: hypothetical protein VNF06_01810 [Candidatus Aquilonibacter sp.]|nr:hypothetical protein [Candidatus Aquilonibacter sp.]